MGVGDHNGSPQQMILPTITHYELLRDRPLLMVFPNNYELCITNYELQIKHYYAQKHLSAVTILLKS